MSKKTNIIEINGKRYDAVTGAIIDDILATPIKKAATANVDGVIRKASPSKAVHTKQTITTHHPSLKATVMATAKPSSTRTYHKPAKNISSHQPEHAHTLMRTAVQKPDTAFKRRVKTQSPSEITTNVIVPKVSHRHIDPRKQARASRIVKSEAVQRFAKAAAAPAMSTTVVTPSAATQAVSASRPSRPSLSIFEEALQKATSHEEQYVQPNSKRLHLPRRLKIISASCALVVAIAGVLVYQNVNNINLYMASSKAGFEASLPTYHPAGFDLGGLAASNGAVSATFKSTSDNRHFTLRERSSSWDSATLRDSYVADVAGHNYQTLQVGGRTIYFYGNHNATWVNGGIWYQLTSTGSLSDQQLIAIATSIN